MLWALTLEKRKHVDRAVQEKAPSKARSPNTRSLKGSSHRFRCKCGAKGYTVAIHRIPTHNTRFTGAYLSRETMLRRSVPAED